jgi:hypothetical protein
MLPEPHACPRLLPSGRGFYSSVKGKSYVYVLLYARKGYGMENAKVGET